MDFTFEIVEHIGVLSQTNNGWKKELNLVSWNGREPVYDQVRPSQQEVRPAAAHI